MSDINTLWQWDPRRRRTDQLQWEQLLHRNVSSRDQSRNAGFETNYIHRLVHQLNHILRQAASRVPRAQLPRMPVSLCAYSALARPSCRKMGQTMKGRPGRGITGQDAADYVERVAKALGTDLKRGYDLERVREILGNGTPLSKIVCEIRGLGDLTFLNISAY
jgi:hypothetical protein